MQPPPGDYRRAPPFPYAEHRGYDVGKPNAAYDPNVHAFTGSCPEAKQALQLGIFSLFCFGFILGPIAIVRGLNAKRLIAANPGMQGDGNATAGIILGSVALALNLFGFVASLATR